MAVVVLLGKLSMSSSAPSAASFESALKTQRYRIAAMDCLSEEHEIRQALARLPGLAALEFDLVARQLSLTAPAELLDSAVKAITQLGYAVEALDENAAPETTAQAQAISSWARWWRMDFSRPLLALVFAAAAEVGHFLGSSLLSKTGSLLLALLAIWLAGSGVYRKGLAALKQRHLNINALMTVAVSGAVLIGDWPEAAMVMALYALAELIEVRAVAHARGAMARLLDMAPLMADVLEDHGHVHARPVSQVQPGMRLRVRPGARFAVDGVVIAGMSAVDEAALSGESLPVDKIPGAAVYAGTINGSGLLEIEAQAAADQSFLARIIHAVESAQAGRAPTQRFVDRFAVIYTPAVFFLALAVALLGPWLADWDGLTALYRALVLLVIACPCALVIATPVTLVSALAAATRRGMLIKGGAALETARRLKLVAFDKTGTLTHGQPQLVAQEVLTEKLPATQVLALAACLARQSDHPVSQAIARGLHEHHCLVPPEQYTALPGRGVSAHHQQDEVWLGNHRLIEELGLCSPALEARLAAHEALGRSITLLVNRSGALALLAVADTLRDESRAVVDVLHARGVRTALLSGDNARTAAVMAAAVGIDEVQGELLPVDKQSALNALRERHGAVAMVGDGINDAPALAQADLGIAMGGIGSDVALETADVVIMNDDLRRIPELLQLSSRTYHVLWQNILLALGIKAVFLLLALLGQASLWMAVFADTGATLLVVLNGLRMLRNT